MDLETHTFVESEHDSQICAVCEEDIDDPWHWPVAPGLDND